MSIADWKARLANVPGIETLTSQLIGGRLVFGFNGLIAAVDPLATEQEIEDAIRNAADLAKFGRAPADKTPLPPVGLMPAQTPEGKPMSVTGAKYAGSSVKSELRAIKTMLAEGQTKMRAAITEMREAAEIHNGVADSVMDDARSLKADMSEFTNGAEGE